MLTVLVCPFICNNLHVISAVFEQFIFLDQNCHLQFSFTENLTLITQVITEGYRVGSEGGGGGAGRGENNIKGQNVLTPMLCFALFSRDRWLKHA